MFCVVLLLLSLYGHACKANDNYVITGTELRQLSEIFDKLATLNEKLNNELSLSKQNLQQLEAELAQLKNELQTLRDKLERLKNDLAESQISLTRSEEELTQLREQLQIAENSLKQLEQSFAEYRHAAESRLKRVILERNLAILVAVLMLLV